MRSSRPSRLEIRLERQGVWWLARRVQALDRRPLQERLARLADRGVRLGTSSWKYRGWCGGLYDEARYVFRGRFSEKRFHEHCLAEYAEVFKTVGVDAAYYQFPTPRLLEGLVAQVPEDFQFALKVTDQITLKRFPNLPRFGRRAGQPNPNFLNAELFQSAFLKPCEPFRRHLGLLMFEFSRFYPADYQRGRDFLEALDTFLARLPGDWRYGVEIRNRHFLHPEYFGLLARRRVTHVFNSWEAMPPLDAQLDLPGSRTTPDLVAARLLLRPGRAYEEAVARFSPYAEIKEPYPEGRAAGARIVREALTSGGRTRLLLYVNNRFEGNALQTIEAILAAAGADGAAA